MSQYQPKVRRNKVVNHEYPYSKAKASHRHVTRKIRKVLFNKQGLHYLDWLDSS